MAAVLSQFTERFGDRPWFRDVTADTARCELVLTVTREGWRQAVGDFAALRDGRFLDYGIRFEFVP